jgi:hypothetical protein
MSQISSWSSTAASNNSTPPDGWPEGMAVADVNNTGREMMAAIRTWWQFLSPTVTAAGTADALTLTYSPAPASLYAGLTLAFYKQASDNTGAVTLNVNGLGVKNVVKRDGSTALGAADLKANTLYQVSYDGTSFRVWQTGV